MKLKKKAVSIILCSAIIASTTGINYAAYTDTTRHWAKTYIEDLQAKQLISGYEDGSFKPDAPVSRLESAIMLSKLFDQQKINSTYEAKKGEWTEKFKKYNIPDWSWPYMVFAVENNILPGDDNTLSKIISPTNKNIQLNALRYEVSVFLVRALKLEGEMSKTAVLKYKDNAQIIPQAIPYIDILIKKGIISETGDQNGNFGADRPITRAEISVMLSNAYKYSDKATQASPDDETADPDPNTIDPGTAPALPPTPPEPVVGSNIGQDNKYNVLQGEVGLITPAGDRMSIVIIGPDGMYTSFYNDLDDVEFKEGNVASSISNIKQGDIVKVLYEGTNKVVAVISQGQEQKVNGIFTSTGSGDVVQIMSNGIVQSFLYDSQTKVTLDGITSDIRAIRADDRLDIFVVGGKATQINAYSTAVSTARLKNLVITQVKIGTSESNITAQDSAGKSYSFIITPETRIRINNSSKSVSDLQIGYEADIYANGTKAEEIVSYGNYNESVTEGTVSAIDTQNGFIEVEKSDKSIIKVYYNRSTQIEDVRSGNLIDARKIFRGDGVIIVGIEQMGAIEANRIMVTIKY